MMNVSSIAVYNGNALLMGKRRDSGKWTLPGGCREGEESAHQTALRELREETGIEAHAVEPLGDKRVVNELGNLIWVHAYRYTCAKETSVELDPDDEVDEWVWIESGAGLPESVLNNLHAPRNVTLELLGLQPLEKSFVIDADPLLVVDPNFDVETAKSLFFISDIMKAGPHKYIRKYKSQTGKWIYIYHEAGNRPRRMDNDEVAIHHRLADLGHEHHQRLRAETREHHPEKLAALRRLADLGNKDAKKHLTENMGIDYEGEKTEHKILRGKRKRDAKRRNNLMHKDQVGDRLTDMHNRIGEALGAVHGHLERHDSSPYAKALRDRGITHASAMREIKKHKNVHDALQETHRQLKKVDQAHASVTERARNSDANDAGGYGNLGHNRVVKALKDTPRRHDGQGERFLPSNAEESISRDKTADELTMDTGKLHDDLKNQAERDRREAAERAERERRERAEREAREARERAEREEEERRMSTELEGSMASHMASLVSSRMTPQRTMELHRELTKIFGRNMRREDWPYDFEGLKTKINSFNLGTSGDRGDISMSLAVYDASGNQVTDIWKRKWSGKNGNFHIYNAHLEVNPQHRKHGVGQKINMAQMKMLMKHGPESTVKVGANIDVGGYNWANQGFSFTHADELEDYRRSFKRVARNEGISLSDADMELFTKPLHFAAFDNGKLYERRLRRAMPLTESQKSTGFLSGRDGVGPRLTDDEVRNKKTGRMVCHFGKYFMLMDGGRSWSGKMTAREARNNDTAINYFKNYAQMRERARGVLSEGYNQLVARAGGAPVAASGPASTPAVDRSPVRLPRGHADWALERLQEWYNGHRDRLSPRQSRTINRLMSEKAAA
jgi:8-oxo-dGTP pyrophosphatase MutT (NUDIX family)